MQIEGIKAAFCSEILNPYCQSFRAFSFSNLTLVLLVTCYTRCVETTPSQLIHHRAAMLQHCIYGPTQ